MLTKEVGAHAMAIGDASATLYERMENGNVPGGVLASSDGETCVAIGTTEWYKQLTRFKPDFWLEVLKRDPGVKITKERICIPRDDSIGADAATIVGALSHPS